MDIVRKIGFGFTSSALLLPYLVRAQFALPDQGDTGLADTSVTDILTGLMKWLLMIVAIIAVIAFVIAGILYLTAAGDSEQIEKAKKAMIWSIVGVVVALLGVIVMNAVQSWLGGGDDF